MISISKVNTRQESKHPCVVFKCDECSEKYGFAVEYLVPITRRGELSLTEHTKRTRGKWSRYRREFELFHDKCGVAEADARINAYIPNLEEKIEFCKKLYADNPTIKFAEVQRRWKEHSENSSNRNHGAKVA